jgi:hypothetical protein
VGAGAARDRQASSSTQNDEPPDGLQHAIAGVIRVIVSRGVVVEMGDDAVE